MAESVFGEYFLSITPIAMMLLYFIGNALTIADYSGYIRFRTDVYGGSFVNAYLIFTILGTVTYFLWAGPCWLYSAKYAGSPSDARTKLTMGMVGVLLFHDLPLLILQYHAILCCGWRNGFDNFVFIVQNFEFFISFVYSWLMYAYIFAGFLDNAYSGGAAQSGLKTGAVEIRILPPLSREEELRTPVLHGTQHPSMAANNNYQDSSPRAMSQRGRPWGVQGAYGSPPLRSGSGGPASPHSSPMSPRRRGGAGTHPIPLQENLGESATDDDAEQASTHGGGHFSPREYQHYAPGNNGRHDGGGPPPFAQRRARPLGAVFVERTTI